MMTAMLAVRNLEGGAFNLWNVNTDAEYHEDGPDSEGKRVLFDFMGAADVLDLLMSIGTYLTHLRALQPRELRELLSAATARGRP